MDFFYVFGSTFDVPEDVTSTFFVADTAGHLRADVSHDVQLLPMIPTAQGAPDSMIGSRERSLNNDWSDVGAYYRAQARDFIVDVPEELNIGRHIHNPRTDAHGPLSRSSMNGPSTEPTAAEEARFQLALLGLHREVCNVDEEKMTHPTMWSGTPVSNLSATALSTAVTSGVDGYGDPDWFNLADGEADLETSALLHHLSNIDSGNDLYSMGSERASPSSISDAGNFTSLYPSQSFSNLDDSQSNVISEASITTNPSGNNLASGLDLTNREKVSGTEVDNSCGQEATAKDDTSIYNRRAGRDPRVSTPTPLVDHEPSSSDVGSSSMHGASFGTRVAPLATIKAAVAARPRKQKQRVSKKPYDRPATTSHSNHGPKAPSSTALTSASASTSNSITAWIPTELPRAKSPAPESPSNSVSPSNTAAAPTYWIPASQFRETHNEVFQCPLIKGSGRHGRLSLTAYRCRALGVCGESVDSPRAFADHLAEVHKIPKGKNATVEFSGCAIGDCREEIKTSSYLRHIETHTTHFVCPVIGCNGVGAGCRSDKFQKHMKAHQLERRDPALAAATKNLYAYAVFDD